MIQVKIKRIHPLAKLPKQAREGDAGMDLFSVEELYLQPGSSALIAKGILMQKTERK